jgi:GT2 family glycosyltransferase
LFDDTFYYEVTALSGNAMLYRKDCVDHPFPKRYFAYAEDVFFNFYLLSLGYTLALCPQSLVHHYGSGSFGKTPSDFKLFYGNRNQIVNFLVFYNVSTIIKLFPLFLLTQVAHLFVNVPFKRIKAKIQARIWIFRNRNKVKMLRKNVQSQKKISDKLLICQLSTDMVNTYVTE